ncbi:MAG: hypothetical protein ACRDA4_07900 [Filifactoraceae bacterium]
MNIQLGQVVESIAGRDKNNYFLVVEVINKDNVKIADGDLRKIQNPKNKKLKHIKPLVALANIPSYESKDPNTLNALIRKELKQLGYSNKED